jgi:cytochrome oxidase Cu insertion factor (SCO1/SenC/PrrC family)
MIILQIKSVTKKFRAYYSRAPAPDGAPAEDYLVDHSIIIYLLGPNG